MRNKSFLFEEKSASFNSHHFNNGRYNKVIISLRIDQHKYPIPESTALKRSFTHRGKPQLTVKGFTYHINNKTKDKTYWICARNRSIRCGARLITKTTSTGDDVIVKRKEQHNHPKNVDEEK